MAGSLLLLLPISLLMAVLIGAAFWWAIFAGQFDDSGEAGQAILQDDDSTAPAGRPSGATAQDNRAAGSGEASCADPRR